MKMMKKSASGGRVTIVELCILDIRIHVNSREWILQMRKTVKYNLVIIAIHIFGHLILNNDH